MRCGGAERHNTRQVGIGVRAVIRLVPWEASTLLPLPGSADAWRYTISAE
jgi:hypothetical protein